MWNRKELKAKAKAALKRNYWYCVLAALLMIVVTVAFSGGVASGGNNAETANNVRVSVSYGAAAMVLLIRLLARNPFIIGGNKFFADNAAGNAPLNDLTAGFTKSYVRNVLAMMLHDLFIFLWTLLFVIPGIVKSYSYRMVPYILADDPEIDAKAAIDLSRKMMKGQKWKAFILDLSFIGWHLLSVMTFGLVGLFYVNPYTAAASAELYLALKNQQ